MIKPKLSYILFILFVIGIADTVFCQDTTLKQQTPFRKYRTITSLSGNIRSSTSKYGENDFSGRRYINSYTFDLAYARMVIDRLGLGASVTFNRSSSDELAFRETEIFTVGPVARYYISDNHFGSIFFNGGVHWMQFLEHSEVDVNLYSTEIEYEGKGFGGVLGIGYTFTMLDRVGFDIAMGYQISHINGEARDLILGTSYSDSFMHLAYRFSFGFIVLLDKIRE